jgi:endonuclease/exonuclease/phosphatase family metal-dependent hydrolase
MKQKNKKKHIFRPVAVAFLLFLSACSGNEPAAKESVPATVRTSSVTTSATTSATQSATESDTTSITSSGTASGIKIDPPTEEFTDTETESTEKGPLSTELVLATLNIKHGAEGLDTIAEAIKEFSPDIIGLEEVDVFCERSGYVDEPAELAELAGYPYFAFSKAINLGDGEYGTAILSRYPIESFDVTPLESGNGERRSLGHAVVNVEGLPIDVFVTHLSYESRSLRIEQMEAIAEILSGCNYYALMGDLNSFNLEDVSYLGGAYYVNRPDRSYTTFRRRSMSIDHIVVSRGFTELSSGVSEKECSDHKMLYARFRFSEES